MAGIGRGLLGRHVRRRAERHAHGREPGRLLGPAPADAVSALATPKSVTTATPCGQQHVVRLDVAVHHAALVRVGERGGDVAQEPDRLGDRQLAVTVQPGAERFAVHERHREVREARRLAGGEQRDDVRMLKLRGELDLAAEPVDAHARRELGQKHLHHDLPPQRDLRRHEHPRHAAAPELALEVVRIAK